MLKNGFYNVAGAVVRIGTSLLLAPFLIRALGVEGYGLWIIVLATLGLVGLLEGGVSLAMTVFGSKYLDPEYSQKLAQTFTIAVAVSIVLASLAGGFVFLGSSQIDRFSYLFDGFSPGQIKIIAQTLQIGGILVFMRIAQQNLVGLQQAYQKYAVLNILETTQVVFTGIGALVIAQGGGRIFEMMLWHIGIGAIILCCHGWSCYRITQKANLSWQWNRQIFQEFTRFSGTAWLGSIGGNLYNTADKLVVGSTLGPSAVALYGVITTVALQINVLSSLPVQPIVPMMSGLLHQKNSDPEILKGYVRRGFQLSVIVALGVGVILITLAPLVMQILVPNRAGQNAVGALQLAVVIYISYSINAVGYFILVGANAVLISTILQICGAALALIAIKIGSMEFGLIGAIAGNAGFALVIFMTIFGMKLLKISGREWLGWLKVPLACFCVCGVVAVFIPFLDFTGLRIFLAAIEAAIFLTLLMKSQKIGFSFKNNKLNFFRY